MRLAVARYFPHPDDGRRQDMERYIDRMTRPIGDMTDLVHIEREILTVHRSWLDLTQLARDVVEAYLPNAMARRVMSDAFERPYLSTRR
jgi:hypothetical protein